MKFFAIALTFLVALLFTNCNAPRKGGTDPSHFSSAPKIEEPDNSLTLVQHLRRVPGVQITGSGLNAKITIRGISTINANTEPLFVVDGQPLAGGLSEAIQLIPVEDIKNIMVLKNPEDTGIYGVRGANGVIEISLKRGTH